MKNAAGVICAVVLTGVAARQALSLPDRQATSVLSEHEIDVTTVALSAIIRHQSDVDVDDLKLAAVTYTHEVCPLMEVTNDYYEIGFWLGTRQRNLWSQEKGLFSAKWLSVRIRGARVGKEDIRLTSMSNRSLNAQGIQVAELKQSLSQSEEERIISSLAAPSLRSWTAKANRLISLYLDGADPSNCVLHRFTTGRRFTEMSDGDPYEYAGLTFWVKESVERKTNNEHVVVSADAIMVLFSPRDSSRVHVPKMKKVLIRYDSSGKVISSTTRPPTEDEGFSGITWATGVNP